MATLTYKEAQARAAITPENLIRRGFRASGRSSQYQTWEQYYFENNGILITYTLWDDGFYDCKLDDVYETVEQIVENPVSLAL